MRPHKSALVLSIVGLLLLGATANGQDGRQGRGKSRRAEAEKVELKDVPAAVLQSAKKELPAATFTTAQKYSPRKLGAVYILQGKDGKYAVSVMVSSSGELQRLTKSLERNRK